MIDPHALAPDTVFADRYRVTASVEDRGAFVLYAAARIDDARPVTLLVLEPYIVRDESQRARFRRLVRVSSLAAGAARFTEVTDSAADDAGAWLAFEPPAGETLINVLARAPLAEPEARAALVSIAWTLTSLHDAGFAHGDVSTENVWYAKGIPGSAVTTLLVPGLGPFVRGAQRLDNGARVTPSAFTVAHLAPEVVMGRPEGSEGDVWSLALLAYELLTGASYWEAARGGGTAVQLVVEVMTASLAPASERAKGAPRPGALPIGFDAWFARCLAREPGARPPMREVAVGLRSLLEAPIQPEIILGNPKGSFYDKGFLNPDELSGYRGVGPVKPEMVVGNPKGSFYDKGLVDRPKRWPYAVGAALLAVAGAALGAWLASR